MSFITDALDVLGNGTNNDNKPSLSVPTTIKPKVKIKRKPEGMHRELYSLICDDKKEPPPILVSDYTAAQYVTSKANLNKRKKVRKWVWAPFIHMERKDNLKLFHWQREEDLQSNKPYPFAKFNKTVEVSTFTDEEYDHYLTNDKWTRGETLHLMDLAKRFNLSFPIMSDRWDKTKFGDEHCSIEDLKERYFDIHNTLAKARTAPNVEPKLWIYDGAHEKKRKQQLTNLWNRTPEQIEEEQHLLLELKRIEARKRDRERKSADLPKIIAAADTNLALQRFKKMNQPEVVGPALDEQQLRKSKFSHLKYQSLKTVLPDSLGNNSQVDLDYSSSSTKSSSQQAPANNRATGMVDIKQELASNNSDINVFLDSTGTYNDKTVTQDAISGHKRKDFGDATTPASHNPDKLMSYKRLKSGARRVGSNQYTQRFQGSGLGAQRNRHNKSQTQQNIAFDQGVFAGIKFPDTKYSGASLRSYKMKLPVSLGQKKTKAVEQALTEFGLEHHPPATEEMVDAFNQLRSDIVLLYELKSALTNAEHEIQYQKHYLDSLRPSDTSSHADDEASSVGDNLHNIKEEMMEVGNRIEGSTNAETPAEHHETTANSNIKMEYN